MVNYAKFFAALTFSSLASVATYFAMGYMLDSDLYSLEYSILRDDLELQVDDNGSDNTILKFIVTQNQTTSKWQCYLNGKPNPDTNFSNDKDQAKTSVQAELKELFEGKDKKSNKWGLMKSCAHNRKNNADAQANNNLLSAEIYFEIEKREENWKIKQLDKEALIKGNLEKSK